MSQETADAVQVNALAAAPPPAIELGIQAPLTGGAQQVFDEDGNPSMLYVGPSSVSAGPVQTPDPNLRFVVAGNPNYYALMGVQSSGPEAAIQYRNADGIRWHVGSGGGPGAGAFFFWNEKAGIVATIKDGTLTFNGTIVANGLTLNGGATLQGIQPASKAPPGANLESVFVDTNTGKLYYQ